MIISCMGHAKFVIELDNGLRIVTDPYDASCGYPVTANPADVVLVSHQHHDHNAVETIPGNPRVIDRAGDFDLGGGAAVRAVWVLLANLPFIVIQRYNRPRLVRLAALLRKREQKKGDTSARTDTDL